MEVSEWIDEFILEHLRRTGRRDFPIPGSDDGDPFWAEWERQFKLCGMTPDVARQASLKVCEDGNLYPNQHLPTLITEARKIFKQNIQGGGGPNDRETAKDLTPEDCECRRSGIIIRFRHVPTGDMKGHNASGGVLTFYCVCEMGRWLKRNHSHEIRKHFGDLVLFPSYQLGPVDWADFPDNQFRYHPRHWDNLRNTPIKSESLYASDKEALRKGYKIPRLEFKRPKQETVDRMEPTPEQLALTEERRRMLESQIAGNAPLPENDF